MCLYTMKRTWLLTLTLLCLFMGVVVEGFAPTDTLHTTTDLNGNFHLKQVPSGDVRVRVTYLGYKPHVQDSVHIAPLFSCGPSNVL